VISIRRRRMAAKDQLRAVLRRHDMRLLHRALAERPAIRAHGAAVSLTHHEIRGDDADVVERDAAVRVWRSTHSLSGQRSCATFGADNARGNGLPHRVAQ